jgi:putative membrane protein
MTSPQRLIIHVAAFLATAALPFAAWAQEREPYYHHPHMWGGDWSMMFFGPLMMIVVIAAIIVVVVLIVRWLGGPGYTTHPPAPHHRTPLDILKERFARGEIDQAEYEERRRALGE